MSEISEIEIKSMIKEQNYMRGYEDGKSDILDKIRIEFTNRYPKNYAGELDLGGSACHFSLNEILEIIDKYRNEVDE